jgi:hypothetical protein
MIYDYDLQFLICKVETDEKGETVKINNENYVIDIPEFNIYIYINEFFSRKIFKI